MLYRLIGMLFSYWIILVSGSVLLGEIYEGPYKNKCCLYSGVLLIFYYMGKLTIKVVKNTSIDE